MSGKFIWIQDHDNPSQVDRSHGGLSRFLDYQDDCVTQGRLGLLSNQTAFDVGSNRYLAERLNERGVLKRVFLPEHGLFAELQDQKPMVATDPYRMWGLDSGVEFCSLYGEEETSLIPPESQLKDLDGLVVDIQDVGARYYTFATTLRYVLEALAQMNWSGAVYVLDRPNPAGRLVEGTPLPAQYESFVGSPGIPHRHGLTLAELALKFWKPLQASYDLIGFAADQAAAESPWDESTSWTLEIPPSPNMPHSVTPWIYSGQCLLEGTNLSEGRGTTRPFEWFGAAFLSAEEIFRSPRDVAPFKVAGGYLRPHRFIPMFHKEAGKVCEGFQIHLKQRQARNYHSLAHTLQILKWTQQTAPDAFRWRTEPYEYRSDRPAIELLAGDEVLLDYLRGDLPWDRVVDRLQEGELSWMESQSEGLLYSSPLFRA